MREFDLDSIVLEWGSHAHRDGMCVMEAVAWVAGEPWTDSPECASPVIAGFMRVWNDTLPDDQRQMLKQWVLPMIRSRGSDAIEEKRAWMVADWLVGEIMPVWLRAAGLDGFAAKFVGVSAGRDDVYDLLEDISSDLEPVCSDFNSHEVCDSVSWAGVEAAVYVLDANASVSGVWSVVLQAQWVIYLAAGVAVGHSSAGVEAAMSECRESASRLVDRMLELTASHGVPLEVL